MNFGKKDCNHDAEHSSVELRPVASRGAVSRSVSFGCDVELFSAEPGVQVLKDQVTQLTL